jgi:hypothetical protein
MPSSRHSRRSRRSWASRMTLDSSRSLNAGPEDFEPRPFDDPDPLDDDFAAVERFADDVASASITV